MIVTYKFNLDNPDDVELKEKYDRFPDFLRAMRAYTNWLRGEIRYRDNTALTQSYEKLYALLDEYEVHID